MAATNKYYENEDKRRAMEKIIRGTGHDKAQ